MGDGTAHFNGSLSTSDTFQQAHPALQGLKCSDIDQIRTRHSVLRDQDRLAGSPGSTASVKFCR
jgi:hypothetical protein